MENEEVASEREPSSRKPEGGNGAGKEIDVARRRTEADVDFIQYCNEHNVRFDESYAFDHQKISDEPEVVQEVRRRVHEIAQLSYAEGNFQRALCLFKCLGMEDAIKEHVAKGVTTDRQVHFSEVKAAFQYGDEEVREAFCRGYGKGGGLSTLAGSIPEIKQKLEEIGADLRTYCEAHAREMPLMELDYINAAAELMEKGYSLVIAGANRGRTIPILMEVLGQRVKFVEDGQINASESIPPLLRGKVLICDETEQDGTPENLAPLLMCSEEETDLDVCLLQEPIMTKKDAILPQNLDRRDFYTHLKALDQALVGAVHDLQHQPR